MDIGPGQDIAYGLLSGRRQVSRSNACHFVVLHNVTGQAGSKEAQAKRGPPGREDVVRSRGGDRGEHGEAECPADLLRGVDQPAREALLLPLDSGYGRDG